MGDNILICVVNLHHAPGLTFDEVAKEIGRDEVWVAAAFYGQVGGSSTLA